MGFTVKLRKYEADVESWWTPRRVATAAAAAAVLLCAVGALFLVPASTSVASTTVSAPGEPRFARTGSFGEVHFVARNWSGLRHGRAPEPPTTLETDFAAPEWENYEVLKNLKAMAIFEAKSPPADTAREEDMARSLFREMKK